MGLYGDEVFLKSRLEITESLFMEEYNNFNSLIESIVINESIGDAIKTIITKIKELWTKLKNWVKEKWNKLFSYKAVVKKKIDRLNNVKLDVDISKNESVDILTESYDIKDYCIEIKNNGSTRYIELKSIKTLLNGQFDQSLKYVLSSTTKV